MNEKKKIKSPYISTEIKKTESMTDAIRHVCHLYIMARRSLGPDYEKTTVKDVLAFCSGLGAGIMVSGKKHDTNELANLCNELIEEFESTNFIEDIDL